MTLALDDLRDEVRAFVAANKVQGLDDLGANAPHDRPPTPAEQRWTDRLRAGRWLCLSWPEEYGGRALSPVECAVVNEEFVHAGAPRIVLGVGERLVGATLLVHGTEAQKAAFLPRIVGGADYWCQGFSEPEAGSDLASVRTRGEIDGDELVITGQKVWTSEAQRSNWIAVLCRTDPTVEKHRGLTFVLVPMCQPGVEVRPLRQAHGGAGFNEVFFDGARTPLRNVIGVLGDGWRVSNTTLVAERGGEATVQHLAYEREWEALVDVARDNGSVTHPIIRRRLVEAWTEVQLMRFSGLRQFAALARRGDPGPAGSLYKVQSSEYHRRFGELAMDVVGPASTILPAADGYAVDRWQRIFFESRSRCISRGTNEIQRNVIAERLLGLPREPRG